MELLLQSGIGELQLLKPMLATLPGKQRIALIQPPYIPHATTLQTWGIDTSRLLWIKPASTGDALWTTEQILKNGSCGAVLCWQSHVRSESLRRLNLAAQSAETWFWLFRPLASASEASPAPLRLGLRPARGGVAIDVLKPRGPTVDHPLYVPLPDMPATLGIPIFQEQVMQIAMVAAGFATTALLGGQDLRVVAPALGHASATTAMVYTEQDTLDLVRAREREMPGSVAASTSSVDPEP